MAERKTQYSQSRKSDSQAKRSRPAQNSQRNNRTRSSYTSASSRSNSSGFKQQNQNFYSEVDRYNYVDRDIYSKKGSSSKRSSSTTHRKKKKHTGLKKFGVLCLSLFVFVILAGVAYAGIMLSRMDRQDVDTNAYIQQPSAAPDWEVIDDNNITNILLLGVDKGDDGLSSRSDTCMLVSVDNQTKTLRMVSFLRDLYVEIPTVGMGRFNTAYTNGGAGLTMQTLENNFRISVDKYIEIDFEGLTAVVDRIGGIDVKMSAAACEEENEKMKSNLQPGKNHLNGKLALYYARIRHIDSDFGRTGRQQQVLQAIMEKCRGLNLAELSALAYDFLPYVTTNLSNEDLLYLISLSPQILKEYDIQNAHIPDDNAYRDLTLPSGAMVLEPDLKENCRILREFLRYDLPAVSE